MEPESSDQLRGVISLVVTAFYATGFSVSIVLGSELNLEKTMKRRTQCTLAVVIVGGTIVGVLVVAAWTVPALPCLLCGGQPSSYYEKLELVSYHFSSPTNVTLNMKNNDSFSW